MAEIEFTLVKKETFNLKPFGRFTVKWNPSKAINKRPHIISMMDLSYDSRQGMPLEGENVPVDKEIIKFMKKHKTDILTDGYRFYTRAGAFTEVAHPKLNLYAKYLTQFEVEDNEETWDNYKNNR